MRRPERHVRLGAAAALTVAGLVSVLLALVAALPAEARGPVADDLGPTAGPTADPTADPTAGPSAGATAGPTDVPSATPTAAPTTAPVPAPETVDGAVLRWGLSDQSNARSHNPAAINFLAAGVANPGRGGATLRRSQWHATQGDVAIEKRTSGGWRTATWDGLGTDPAGRPIGVHGPFSEHTVVLRNGTGTIDRAAGTATVSWRGTFTVVYYGGNSIFTVTDPALAVADGAGTLTAGVGGFAADREDASSWTAVPTQRVRIADLPGVGLGDLGFTAQPAYEGVEVTGSVAQERTGESWGSFPQPLVSSLGRLGIDQFWYSTGLQSDPTKVALPLTVSWTPHELPAPTPTAATSAPPEVQNSAPPPPSPPPPTVPGAPSTAAPVRAPAAAPAVAVPPTSGAAGLPAAVQLAAAPAPAPEPSTAAAGSGRTWLSGGFLLLAAAGLLLVPTGRPARSRP